MSNITAFKCPHCGEQIIRVPERITLNLTREQDKFIHGFSNTSLAFQQAMLDFDDESDKLMKLVAFSIEQPAQFKPKAPIQCSVYLGELLAKKLFVFANKIGHPMRITMRTILQLHIDQKKEEEKKVKK